MADTQQPIPVVVDTSHSRFVQLRPVPIMDKAVIRVGVSVSGPRMRKNT